MRARFLWILSKDKETFLKLFQTSLFIISIKTLNTGFKKPIHLNIILSQTKD